MCAYMMRLIIVAIMKIWACVHVFYLVCVCVCVCVKCFCVCVLIATSMAVSVHVVYADLLALHLIIIFIVIC